MASADLQLQQLCDDALREAGELSALQEDVIRADIELRYLHAGEYVAYIDGYEEQDRIGRLAREVIACGSDLSEVKSAFSDVDSERRARIRLEYLEPLRDDFETHDDLPLR